MKLLVSEPGRLVVQLTQRERQEMRAVLHAMGNEGRKSPSLTRGGADGMPSDAGELLAKEVLGGLESDRRSAMALLEDPARCVRGKGGYGLQMAGEGEAEGLLRALNGARVAFWEALGSPDFEAGERVEPTDPNRLRVALMEVSGELVGRWLACLGGEASDEE